MDTVSELILVVLAIVVFTQVRDGKAGQWFRAKFFNAGEPSRDPALTDGQGWGDLGGAGSTGGGLFSPGGAWIGAAGLDDLAEPLRSDVQALVAEAGPGKVTWTSTRRTREQQAQLRIANGCPDVDKSPARTCRVPTAIPGTSKHETGEAIDFTNTSAVINTVARLAGRHHIHRTVPGERWHYESAR